MKKVLFVGYDNHLGLTYHLTDWIVSLSRVMCCEYEMHYLISNKTQNFGLYEKLISQVHESSSLIFREEYDEAVANDMDIVHCQSFKQAIYYCEHKKKYSCKYKVVITVHAYRNTKWYKDLFKLYVSARYDDIDKYIFLSSYSRKDFLSYNPFYRVYAKSVVVPLGINIEEFESSDNNDRKLDEPGNKKKLVYFAQMHNSKGHKWIISAFSKVNRDDCQLWLYGDGPLREKLIDYVKKKSISDKVFFPGRVEREMVPCIYREAYLALAGTKNETFGHLYLEPFAAATPVVGVPVGIGEQLLQDYLTGFRVKYGDVSAMARCITILLDDPKMKVDMGNNCLKIIEKYSWDNIARIYRYVYSDMFG